jgi:glycosyltransferase involved in cell wall biosynthesis
LLVQFEKHRYFWKYPEALYNDSICLLPAAEAAPLSGIIAPIADVSALASALERLLDNIGLAQDLGFRAKKRAQDFSLVSVGTQLRSFLVAHANSQTNLLHGQRPPSRPLLNG